MPNLSNDDLETLVMGAYAEGWNDRHRVPEHKVFEVRALDFWLKSLTRRNFLNRSSSVTSQPPLATRVHEPNATCPCEWCVAWRNALEDAEAGWQCVAPDGSLLTLTKPKRETTSEG